MRRRLLPITLLALGALVATGCGDSTTAAVRVGDDTVDEAEFLDSLDEFAGNEAFVGMQARSTRVPDGYEASFVTVAVNDWVYRALNNAAFDERDLELTDEDRRAARSVLGDAGSNGTSVLDEFSDEFAARYLDDVARQVKLGETLGEDAYGAWLQDAFARADIEVNPRFGSWDRTSAQAVPPRGPVDAPT